MKLIRHLVSEHKKQKHQVDDFFKSCKQKIKSATNYNCVVFSIDQPRPSLPEGDLFGVPVFVKDNICVQGMETTAASKMLKGFVSPYSATLVERLESQGAYIIGKTNLDEFGMGSKNTYSVFGAVKNPINEQYSAGGSSGGSAAAVALGLAPVAIGTDTGGSVRQPANFCGVFGIKPTYGRISRYGLISYASSLDQAGILSQQVEDAAQILKAIAGYDPKDSTSSSVNPQVDFTQFDGGIQGQKFAVPSFVGKMQLDAEVLDNFKKSIQKIQNAGGQVDYVDMPMLQYSVEVYYIIAMSEASSNLSRYDGVRFGHRSVIKPMSLEDFYQNNRSEGFGEEVKKRIAIGTYALSSGYYDEYYGQACKARTLICEEFKSILGEYNAIVTPVSTSAGFKLDEPSDSLKEYQSDIFTTGVNLAGLPAASVPTSKVSSGLPIGIQVIGNYFDEQCVFNFGKFFQEQSGGGR